LTRRALAFVLTLLLPVIATAQAPTAASLSQTAVSRGQTVEVTVTGKSLAAVDNVGLADPRGLDVSIVAPTPPAKDDQLKLRLTAAADATPGERELRLVSPTGVSAPVRVTVEQLPAVAEVEPNNAYEQPQVVSATPAVIVGKIDGAGDIDVFRVSAAKGQTLIVNVLASRIRVSAPNSASPSGVTMRFPNQWTPAVFAAAGTEVGQRFLGFSRFPAARAFADADGVTTVRWNEMRFTRGEAGADQPGRREEFFTATVRIGRDGRIINQRLGR